ncbi:MAG: response regulator, partial [Proteobacteria bacterium]
MTQRVLVFEGDAAFAGELEAELGKHGFEVRVVDDGNAGMREAALAPPDLILLAAELPKMSGFSVCNRLKKDPKLQSIPILILSKDSTDETVELHKKLKTRADDYVRVPLDPSDLLEHMRALVPAGGSGSKMRSNSPSDGSELLVDED